MGKEKRKPRGYWQDINNVINHLLPVCKDLGRLPTHKELVARGEKSLFTYIGRFHSLTEISEITGYKMNQKPYGYWNKESVFKEYSELLKMHHKQVPFTKRELIKLGRYDLVNAIRENFTSLLEQVNKSKPPSAKGIFIKAVTLSSTMGPGIKLKEY